ncbi:MAG: class I SAM-dependent methyltransferase [Planctomycetota bacterium]|jgi:hypothetical protein
MDGDGRLHVWEELMGSAAAPLRAEAAACDPGSVGDVARLRRRWSPPLVAAALELAEARRRARRKFPDHPELVADPVGVEQATGERVARHKAGRFAALGAGRVLDLCCGIGGDAMSLAAVADVLAVDRDPLRTWMTGRNARCETRTDDVESMPIRGEVLHVDPGRRTVEGGTTRRAWRLEDCRPGPDVLRRLLADNPDAAVKLGPGADLDALPGAGESEVELVSDGGRLVQAVLWTGRLARHPGHRSATRLPEGATLHGRPAPPPPRADPRFGPFLYVPDPAVERAGLLGALCARTGLAAPHPPLGLPAGDAPVDSPWLTRFDVLHEMPWRPDRVRRWLADHGAGVVEVKTRGRAVDPDTVQARLRGDGPRRLTVFVLRVDRRIRAVVAERAGHSTQA